METPLESTYGARLNAYLTTPEDYRKYRHHVGRKIVSLRRDLSLVHRDTRSYSDKAAELGASDLKKEPKSGLLLLLLVERDVLYALELKALLEMTGGKQHKKLLSTRLKRASLKVQRLLEMTTGDASVNGHEYLVYAALTHGLFAFNKKRWRAARHAYSVARCGLEQLRLARRAVFIDDLLDTIVDPSLKLAQSQIDDSELAAGMYSVAGKHLHDKDVAALAKCVEQSALSSFEPIKVAPKNRRLVWLSHTATVHNDYVARGIKRAQGLKKLLFQARIARWQELVDMHEMDVERNQDNDDEAEAQDDAIILAFLRYNLLLAKLQSYLHEPAQVSQKWNLVIDTASEIAELPGVHNDENLADTFHSLIEVYKARKCQEYAKLYAERGMYAEAFKLYKHARVEPKEYKARVLGLTNMSMESMNERSEKGAQECRVMAQYTRSSPQFVLDDIEKLPIGLQALDRITNVGTTQLQPILSKPVLFDLAYNYIGYGKKAEAKVENSAAETKPVTEEKKEKQTEEKKGLFGFFR